MKFEAADRLVIGSPVYYGSANGTLMSALHRLFYSTSFDKSLKRLKTDYLDVLLLHRPDLLFMRI